MPKELTKTSYQSILADIEAYYTGAKQAMVEMYWKIGKRIVVAEQVGQTKAPYGKRLIVKLSEDLTSRLGEGFSLSNLKRMRQFYLTQPIGPTSGQLTWAKRTELLPLSDKKKRRQLEARAIREHLSSREIRRLVQAETAQEKNHQNEIRPEDKTPLPVKRGKLFTYSYADKSKVIIPKGKTVIDLGFDLWHLADSEELAGVTLTDKPEYTYRAWVEKVIDGDTIWAQIDCGFGSVARQKLRFRGIDAPEMDTPEGKAAQAFVKKRLPAGSVIVIRTHKNDKYDRYLADIFYLPGSADPAKILTGGVFLNQELLDNVLAVKMGD